MADDQPVESTDATEAPVADPAVAAEPEAETETEAEATPAASKPASTSAAVAVAGPAGPRANARKVREGLVVSDRMNETVVVAVIERVRHARYGKTVQRTKKLYVHNADNAAHVGDRVRVVETRPLSKLKRWRLADILERAR
jgi:small subunit ribosomal protein S17